MNKSCPNTPQRPVFRFHGDLPSVTQTRGCFHRKLLFKLSKQEGVLPLTPVSVCLALLRWCGVVSGQTEGDDRFDESLCDCFAVSGDDPPGHQVHVAT